MNSPNRQFQRYRGRSNDLHALVTSQPAGLRSQTCLSQWAIWFKLLGLWSTILSNISSATSLLPNAGVSFR
jgi:hypothetical protein